MLPSEFRAEVLAFIEARGSSFTVYDLVASCDLDQARVGYDGVRWKLYQLLKVLEAEGSVVSWTEPGTGIKHWKLLESVGR